MGRVQAEPIGHEADGEDQTQGGSLQQLHHQLAGALAAGVGPQHRRLFPSHRVLSRVECTTPAKGSMAKARTPPTTKAAPSAAAS